MANTPTFFQRVRNVFTPTYNMPLRDFGGNPTKNLSRYISPVQLQRIRHDVQLWREAISEAEQAWYPHRVKMQRMYVDTILNGHTKACYLKRKDLSLLRDWEFKNESEVLNDDLKKLFDKRWFANFLEYALEARFFGYSLIKLDDIVNDEFPKLGIIRRWNVSPDRFNVIQFVYSLSGAPFLEDPFKDWHVWVPTNSDVGASECGYGLLYDVAMYEILARNALGFNSTAAELYGMPARIGKTNKTQEEERGNFEAALANMGSAGYIVLDAMGDEIELLESKGNGQGFKIYPDLEKRLEAKISKLMLGHADAIDSTPGKLGAGDGESSPAAQALRDKQTADGAFLEDVVNTILIPKMINLGFDIDTTYPFCFSNNAELTEQREKEDKNNLQTATIAYEMKQAGLKMDAKYFEERTGIVTTEIVEPVAPPNPFGGFKEKTQNRLNKLYSK